VALTFLDGQCAQGSDGTSAKAWISSVHLKRQQTKVAEQKTTQSENVQSFFSPF
jgi:hypothetical protein